MNRFSALVVVVGVLVIMFIVLVTVCYFIWRKIRMSKPVDSFIEDDECCGEIDRQDSISFMDFDDIYSDMIICDDYTRFVGVVKCEGYDFYSARAVDKVSSRNGYMSFISSMDKKTITYRKYFKKVDLEGVRQKHLDTYNRIEEELYFVNDECNELIEALNEYRKLTEAEGYDFERDRVMSEELKVLSKKVEALDWRRKHLSREIDYIDGICKLAAPEPVETYLFTWKYEPSDYEGTLSKADIVKRAITGLRQIENSIERTLSQAGVTVTRVRTPELLDMVRRNFSPYKSDVFKLSDIEKSNVYNTVTSASMLELDLEAKRELELLDYINYVGEENSSEVDVIYDVPELAYEGTAVELGVLPDEPVSVASDENVESVHLDNDDIDEEVEVTEAIQDEVLEKRFFVKEDKKQINEEGALSLMDALERMLSGSGVGK